MKRFVFAIAALAIMFIGCTPEDNNSEGDGSGHVTGVFLDRSSVTIKEGENITLIATVKPDNAENKTVTWSSSEPSVASVDNNGKVTGIKAGKATIAAMAEDGGKTASCVVTVEANNAPAVTIGAEHITAISVTLKGKANLTESVSIDLQVGFQYSKSAGILPSNSTIVYADDADADYLYTAKITGLEPGTTYYFRSFVRQNGMEINGETKVFTTKDVSSMLSTQAASSVSALGATLNAKLDLTEIDYSRGYFYFDWGTSPTSLYNMANATQSEEGLHAELSNLDPLTQYYYRATMSLDGKLFSGEVLSFTTTSAESLLKTLEASDVTIVSATIKAELNLTGVNHDDFSYEFFFGLEPDYMYSLYEWAFYNGYEEKEGGKLITAYLSKLDPSTQYYYQIRVRYNYDKVLKGDILSFTTKDIGSVLETKEASSIEDRSAILCSKLDLTNVKYNYISYGFMWGYSEDRLQNNITVEESADNSFSYKISNLKHFTQYWYKAYARIDNRYFYGDIKSFTTLDIPEVVDLGLSVKWRSWNIGASEPEETGNYYAWGETNPKSTYDWNTYKWVTNGITKYCPSDRTDIWGGDGEPDNKTDFKDYDYADDAARVILGGNWRTPTYNEIKELYNYCSWEWTDDYKGTGVSGCLVTSKKTGYNGRSIFLPASGFYEDNGIIDKETQGFCWASSISIDNPYSALLLHFANGNIGYYGRTNRRIGLPVRPVTK